MLSTPFPASHSPQLPPIQTRFAPKLFAAFTACVVFTSLTGASALAQTSAQHLPSEVDAALARAKVPREALAAIVIDAAPALNGKSAPLLAYRTNASVNPASVMKLVTTYAGIELLGPA